MEAKNCFNCEYKPDWQETGNYTKYNDMPCVLIKGKCKYNPDIKLPFNQKIHACYIHGYLSIVLNRILPDVLKLFNYKQELTNNCCCWKFKEHKDPFSAITVSEYNKEFSKKYLSQKFFRERKFGN